MYISWPYEITREVYEYYKQLGFNHMVAAFNSFKEDLDTSRRIIFRKLMIDYYNMNGTISPLPGPTIYSIRTMTLHSFSQEVRYRDDHEEYFCMEVV